MYLIIKGNNNAIFLLTFLKMFLILLNFNYQHICLLETYSPFILEGHKQTHVFKEHVPDSMYPSEVVLLLTSVTFAFG